MSETAPERIWAWPKGSWFTAGASDRPVKAAGAIDVQYVRADIHDISQTERHADGEYIGHLQQRVEELEAALIRIADLTGHNMGMSPAEETLVNRQARAALTPPEQQ